ncbi:MAG: procyclic acidic repetitive family protein [Planctomycetes bacterium]|nr:procyclic acidic repetitive family protein [Planctomycetota bacterium]
MDEQTFRRLAPDAVAGRLDAETYVRWKAGAAQSPERAAFVVRIAEADARFSGEYGPVRDVQARAPAAKVSRRMFFGLALLFAGVGLLAGGMVMQSYLETGSTIAAGGNVASRPAPLNAPPEPDEKPAPPPLDNTETQPEPEHTPEPGHKPEPEPEHIPAVQGFALAAVARGFVSVRGSNDDAWRKLEPHTVIAPGATLGKTTDGDARFESPDLEIVLAGAGQFEYGRDAIRLISGRYRVRVRGAHSFTCYKSTWSLSNGAFVAEPRTLGGELFLLEGVCEWGAAPVFINLDGTGRTAPLTPGQARELELELLGPHQALLSWDGESAETSPRYGRAVKPGARGDGHAIERRPGEPGIGVPPTVRVFDGRADARLRLRVRTDAKRVRLELRVHLEDGYRAVDADIAVPRAGEWCVVDVPLEILRAGRMRDEPGWLPGRRYDALLLSPGVDADNLLQRHELAIDDLLVYVPQRD